MKRLFLGFIFVFVSVFGVSAQGKEARKIDEFSEYSCDDFIIRAQNFLIELSKTPKTKAYIIVYEGNFKGNAYKKGNRQEIVEYVSPQKGEIKIRIEELKKRVESIGLIAEIIIGGLRETHKVEFWLIPFGAKLPKATPTLEKIKYRKGKPRNFCGEF